MLDHSLCPAGAVDGTALLTTVVFVPDPTEVLEELCDVTLSVVVDVCALELSVSVTMVVSEEKMR